MKYFIFLALTISLFVHASDQRSWESFLRNEIPNYLSLFSDINYLKSWRTNSEFVIDPHMMVKTLPEKQFRCSTDKLYPTHPYQSTKEYHAALIADYEYFRLPINSDACLLVNPTRRFCQRGASAKLVITSDLYVDDCGHYYRAYWITAYQSNHESMGTLFAKGRTAYEKPGSQFRNDYVTGATYALKKDDFFYFSVISQKDLRNMTNALNGIERFFTKREKLFIPR